MVCFACSASQEERINMLNLALIEKGVLASGAHYKLTQPRVAATRGPPTPPPDVVMDELNEAEDGGVVL